MQKPYNLLGRWSFPQISGLSCCGSKEKAKYISISKAKNSLHFYNLGVFVQVDRCLYMY